MALPLLRCTQKKVPGGPAPVKDEQIRPGSEEHEIRRRQRQTGLQLRKLHRIGAARAIGIDIQRAGGAVIENAVIRFLRQAADRDGKGALGQHA